MFLASIVLDTIEARLRKSLTLTLHNIHKVSSSLSMPLSLEQCHI